MKKTRFYILFLALGIAAGGCGKDGGISGGSGISGNVTPTQAYTISSATGIGIDDDGQMWIQIDGSFAATDNTVSVSCDGNVISSTLQSQSATSVVTSIPAASFYRDCNFVVQSGGEISGSFDSAITAMSFSGISHVAHNADSTLLNAQLDGNFTTTAAPTKSQVSVLASCDSGVTYFSPNIISENETAIVVSLPNPGLNKNELCLLIVQDTFKNTENNAEIVSSPSLMATINGI